MDTPQYAKNTGTDYALLEQSWLYFLAYWTRLEAHRLANTAYWQHWVQEGHQHLQGLPRLDSIEELRRRFVNFWGPPANGPMHMVGALHH